MALTIQAIPAIRRIFSPATFAAGPVKLELGCAPSPGPDTPYSYDRDFAVCQPKLCIPPCDGYDGGAGNGGGRFRPVSTHDRDASYNSAQTTNANDGRVLQFHQSAVATTAYAGQRLPNTQNRSAARFRFGRITTHRPPRAGWGER